MKRSPIPVTWVLAFVLAIACIVTIIVTEQRRAVLPVNDQAERQ